MKPAYRLQRLPHQLFAQLVEEAQRQAAAGYDVINLGQGNPDQPTADHIVAALKNAASDPQLQRYISFRGLHDLKRAVAEWYHERHQVTLDPSHEIAILIGSKIGLQEISLALLNAGDVAMVPDPGYPDYWSGIALAGGEMARLPLNPSQDFAPDLSAWRHDAKLLFLNYPNNPTGRILSNEHLDAIIAKALQTETVIAYDLAYGDIVFDEQQATSLLARPEGKTVGVEFTTLSKSYNMAGYRIGFAAGNREIIGYLEELQDHLHCSQYGAIQKAGIAALRGPQDNVHNMRHLYQSRRDVFIETVHQLGWPIPPSQGTIFLWCPVPTVLSSRQWAQRLLEEEHVVVAPGSGFGEHGEGYIRISLTVQDARLKDAAQRIVRVIGKYS